MRPMWHFILPCAALGVLMPGIARPQGEPVGTEFRVNTYVMNLQISPSVAIDASGNFVVVWSSRGQDDPGSTFDIYGQRYASPGAPLGPEFHVNTSTSDSEEPSVATDPSGNFVVVWTSAASPADAVLGQRYSSSGAPLGSELRVNTFTTGSQYDPAVAADPAGSFVVVWAGQGGTDPNGIFGQRFGQIVPIGLTSFRVD